MIIILFHQNITCSIRFFERIFFFLPRIIYSVMTMLCYNELVTGISSAFKNCFHKLVASTKSDSWKNKVILNFFERRQWCYHCSDVLLNVNETGTMWKLANTNESKQCLEKGQINQKEKKKQLFLQIYENNLLHDSTHPI